MHSIYSGALPETFHYRLKKKKSTSSNNKGDLLTPVKATLAGMVYAIYSGFWFLSLWLFSFYCLYCISIPMTQNTMTIEFPRIKGRSFLSIIPVWLLQSASYSWDKKTHGWSSLNDLWRGGFFVTVLPNLIPRSSCSCQVARALESWVQSLPFNWQVPPIISPM